MSLWLFIASFSFSNQIFLEHLFWKDRWKPAPRTFFAKYIYNTIYLKAVWVNTRKGGFYIYHLQLVTFDNVSLKSWQARLFWLTEFLSLSLTAGLHAERYRYHVLFSKSNYFLVEKSIFCTLWMRECKLLLFKPVLFEGSIELLRDKTPL